MRSNDRTQRSFPKLNPRTMQRGMASDGLNPDCRLGCGRWPLGVLAHGEDGDGRHRKGGDRSGCLGHDSGRTFFFLVGSGVPFLSRYMLMATSAMSLIV